MKKRVGEIPSIYSVTVKTVADNVLTQDRMTDEAYENREAHFQERIDVHDITLVYDGEGLPDAVTIDTSEVDD